jgi:hypothetical protein
MMPIDGETLFWILLIIVYLYFQFAGGKKKETPPPQRRQAPEYPDDRAMTRPQQPAQDASLEEALREIREALGGGYQQVPDERPAHREEPYYAPPEPVQQTSYRPPEPPVRREPVRKVPPPPQRIEKPRPSSPTSTPFERRVMAGNFDPSRSEIAKDSLVGKNIEEIGKNTTSQHSVLKKLRDPDEARDAFIMAEVLGKRRSRQ